VKWLAISILLSDDQSQDDERSKPARELYELGKTVALDPQVIFACELDGVARTPAAITHTDRIRGSWQSGPTGPPNTLSVVGPDLVALTPAPDTAPHSVMLDVLAAMAVPSGVNDFLQVGREHLDAIYSLSEWILQFKGAAMDRPDSLLRSFMDIAYNYSARQRASASVLDMLRRFSGREATARPYGWRLRKSAAVVHLAVRTPTSSPNVTCGATRSAWCRDERSD
jgi:hypothetical protein